jgi:hypothetical protein
MGPGHGSGSSAVDDFIAQVDNAEAWVFMIQDVHGDVVALVSETGAILARYTYDGFGRILLSEHDGVNTGPEGTQSIKPTANRVGHKGLFFDRYDTPHAWVPGSGIDGLPPTLAAPTTGSVGQAGSWASGGVKGLYYNRNRHFSPNLGRFVQRDPNATGLVLAATPSMHGQQVMTDLQPFDVEFHYLDGPNTHAAYAAGPTLYSDPMGLFSLGGLMGSMATQAAMAALPGPGDFITKMLESLVTDYALNLDWDVEWATDWSTGDDWHSRLDNSWITLSLGRGAADAFEVGVGEYSASPLDLFAGFKPASGGKGPGARNLKALGLQGVKLVGRTFTAGRLALQRAGFVRLPNTETGRIEFKHPATGTIVQVDISNVSRTGKQKPHWHIKDDAGNHYDGHGRPTNKDGGKHIRMK